MGEKIKDGDQYQTPDGSLMVRTSGDGILRSCIKPSDKKPIEALITTDAEPECIFPDRFISATSVAANS